MLRAHRIIRVLVVVVVVILVNYFQGGENDESLKGEFFFRRREELLFRFHLGASVSIVGASLSTLQTKSEPVLGLEKR